MSMKFRFFTLSLAAAPKNSVFVSAVTVNLGTFPEKADFVISIPLPTGSYNYKIEVGNDSEPNVYTAYTTSAQTFGRKQIYKLGELNFYRGNVLLESSLEGEDFTVEPDNPYVWQ